MSPFRKFHVLQRVTATAASPNTLEFMRKNQHLRLGEMRFWQIFTSFPPPLPFSISPGKFHSSLPHTSSGNPMLPFLMELWVRSKWGNWERDGLVWNSGADNCMRTHSVARAMIVEEKWHLNSKIKCGQDNFNAILQVSPKYLSSSMLILPWGMGWWSSTYPEKVLLQRGGGAMSHSLALKVPMQKWSMSFLLAFPWLMQNLCPWVQQDMPYPPIDRHKKGLWNIWQDYGTTIYHT